MVEIKYKGNIYKRYKDKWVDERNLVVHEALQNYLNHVYAESIDLSQLSIQELINEGDKFKESSSYPLAIKYYETASTICDESTLSYILPRISSCYRQCHQPQKAIDLFSYAKQKYGSHMITSALLTTAAAAYCDMYEYDNAKKCCNRAYAQSGGVPDENLKNVYRRIQKETK